MFYAKVAVFVDDELCDRELYDLIPILVNKVHVNGEYVEREFGIAVRILWNSLTDATSTLRPEEIEAIKLLFKSENLCLSQFYLAIKLVNWFPRILTFLASSASRNTMIAIIK